MESPAQVISAFCQLYYEKASTTTAVLYKFYAKDAISSWEGEQLTPKKVAERAVAIGCNGAQFDLHFIDHVSQGDSGIMGVSTGSVTLKVEVGEPVLKNFVHSFVLKKNATSGTYEIQSDVFRLIERGVPATKPVVDGTQQPSATSTSSVVRDGVRHSTTPPASEPKPAAATTSSTVPTATSQKETRSHHPPSSHVSSQPAAAAAAPPISSSSSSASATPVASSQSNTTTTAAPVTEKRPPRDKKDGGNSNAPKTYASIVQSEATKDRPASSQQHTTGKVNGNTSSAAAKDATTTTSKDKVATITPPFVDRGAEKRGFALIPGCSVFVKSDALINKQELEDMFRKYPSFMNVEQNNSKKSAFVNFSTTDVVRDILVKPAGSFVVGSAVLEIEERRLIGSPRLVHSVTPPKAAAGGGGSGSGSNAAEVTTTTTNVVKPHSNKPVRANSSGSGGGGGGGGGKRPPRTANVASEDASASTMPSSQHTNNNTNTNSKPSA